MIWNIRVHCFHHHDKGSAEHPSRVENLLGIIQCNQEQLMIDTSKLLAAVAAEKTESASLRALLAANTQAQRDASAQIASLKDQLAAGSPVTPDQLTAIQNDIDAATADLSTDNTAAEDAVKANTTPAAS